mmetsp:Transcript_78211/g.91308  ORF Transcript_78211/g.91308 Transcript_78211/m.91308 type:complete len:205 (-) Transcript_78211:270-884(-)
MSASMNATVWCSAIAFPIVLRCSAYARLSSRARRATPTAPIAIGGRVKSNAFIAYLNPSPTLPSTFSSGTSTFSNVMPRVSLHRCPTLISFLPRVIPGVSASTMKLTNPSFDLASRKYQFATPPFVIHIFCPFTTHLSPRFSANVFSPATSDPAPGSVTQYAHCSGSSVRRPRYFFFCASLPAMITGADASVFASSAVATPEHA